MEDKRETLPEDKRRLLRDSWFYSPKDARRIARPIQERISSVKEFSRRICRHV